MERSSFRIRIQFTGRGTKGDENKKIIGFLTLINKLQTAEEVGKAARPTVMEAWRERKGDEVTGSAREMKLEWPSDL